MAARVELREITNEEGNRLLRIVRRGSGLGRDLAPGADRAALGAGDEPGQDQRGRLHRPRHGPRGDPQLQPRRLRCALPALSRAAGRRPSPCPSGAQIKKIALSIPTDLGRPFATWSLAKLADYLVAEGVVTDISHEGLRALLREEGVSFQAVRTWKRSNDPELRGQEEPHPGAIRAGRRRQGDRHLPGRVRAAEPAAPARRQGLGAAEEAAADPRHLHPPARRPPHARRLRRHPRPPLRPHQEAQDTGRVPRLLPLRPLALPARGAAALHPRQLQPPPRRRRPRLGRTTTTSSSPTPRTTAPG